MARSASVGRSRIARRAALLACAVVVPLAGMLAGTAQADTSVTVPDVAEAWYAAAPIDVCTTPLGCPPDQVPTSPYPAGSLHVGVAGGQETARSYVQPDLSQLSGATLLRGTMTLHVDTGQTDGSLTPESAKILACLVTAPFTDGTAGSTSAPPATDCSTSAHPVYTAGSGILTVDLAPFLQAWNGGAQQLGIALVPNQTQVTQTDAWHVTIEGHKQAGAKPVTSTIDYRPAPTETMPGVSLPPAAPVTQPVPAGATGDITMPASVSGGAASVPAPVVAAAPPPAAVAQRPVAYAGPITKPIAFLAPLALLAGILFFARLFTRDATPKRMWA
jgi:hypothetical protein